MNTGADKIFDLKPPLKFYVPVKLAELEFTLKESMQLAKLSRFLLTAILEHGSNEEALTDAMLLPQLVIRSELQSLYNQKFLTQDENGKYILTDRAKLLLRYENLTETLNSVKTAFVFNAVNGDLRIYEPSECLDESPEGLAANERLREFELACVEPSQIGDVLLEAFPVITETVEDPELFLDSVVIDPIFEKKNKWMPMCFTRPQPDINDDDNDNENSEDFQALVENIYQPHEDDETNETGKAHENAKTNKTRQSRQGHDTIAVKSYIIQRKYSIHNDWFEKNMRYMERLREVFLFDRSLVSEAGVRKLSECAKYLEEKGKIYIGNIDPLDSSVLVGELEPEDADSSEFKKVLFDLEKISGRLATDGKRVREELYRQIDTNGDLLRLDGTNGYMLSLIEPEAHIPYIIRLPLESMAYCTEENDEEA